MPGWVVLSKLYGLYDRDERRTDHHATTDELVGVLHLVTIGSFVLVAFAWILQVGQPLLPTVLAFWGPAILFVLVTRAAARTYCRRSHASPQNTIILGAGEVGQIVARKVQHHPEYGLNLLGFVDTEPKVLRPDLADFHLLGEAESLPDLIRELDVERVIVAFPDGGPEHQLDLIRSLGECSLQIDIVPRFHEIVGQNVDIRSIEGLPVVSLHPVRLSRSTRLLKRCIDIVGSTIGLILTAPLFAYIAVRVKLDSPGPVFFRQTRLTMNMREFTALKFRTMKIDTPDDEHREYVRATMSSTAAPNGNGLYKLERSDAVTTFGRWLRRTSLDELPQLINVLKGDMSLVGPRPCIAYETENFAPHHFERFLVPAGVTGLWQVSARANASFGEALDMDVAYARSWSLGLDLRLLGRTPTCVLRQRKATA
jgi:exopolysaccharide biosynthesis polyprenyl glycosylphosphotransferase